MRITGKDLSFEFGQALEPVKLHLISAVHQSSLLPAAMPVNNSEPKTWENIRLKSSNSRLWVPTCKEHRHLFCAEIWLYPHELQKPACKNQQFVGQVETQKGSEVCSSDFNNACRVFGADWSIKICRNNFVGEEDKNWRYRFPLSLLFRGHLLP